MNENSTLYSAVTMNLDSTHSQVVPITLFVALLCVCLVIGHLLEEYPWLNESITAILIVRFLSFSSIPHHNQFLHFSIEFSCYFIA